MSSPPLAASHRLPPLVLDDRRGTAGMLLFIVTEASLFVMLFFSYFYLGHQQPLWPPEPPPQLTYPLAMLAVLLASSATLHHAGRALAGGRSERYGIAITIVLGVLFLTLQATEFSDKLTRLRPSTNAYGSIFYTITSVHALHVAIGVFMLLFVLVLPRLEPRERPPHRPLHNVSLYWHFVDAVWIVIVALLYVLPHITRFAA